MIRHIVFFVDSQDFLSLDVLSPHLIEQKRVRAGPDIVEHRFRGHRTALTFQILRDGRGRKGIADVGSDIGNNPLQHIHIPDVVPLHDIFELRGIE